MFIGLTYWTKNLPGNSVYSKLEIIQKLQFLEHVFSKPSENLNSIRIYEVQYRNICGIYRQKVWGFKIVRRVAVVVTWIPNCCQILEFILR